MAALDNVHHAAISHVVEVVRIKAYRGSFSAGVDRHINHGLFFVRLQLLGRHEREAGLGFLAGKRKTTGIPPTSGDAIRHGLRGFGGEGRKPGRVITQVARRDFNRTASGRCQKCKDCRGEQGHVTHTPMLREHVGGHNPPG